MKRTIISLFIIFLIGCSGHPPNKNVSYDQLKVERKVNTKFLERNAVKKSIDEYESENKNEFNHQTTGEIVKGPKTNSFPNVTDAKKEKTQERVLLNVPIVHQMPELYNGCEVSSITMLLQYAGIQVNKFDVAKKIPKDEDLLVQTPSGNILHWGNPNHGFVGSITGKGKKGYGMYNQPIEKVIEYYLPKRSVNLQYP